MTRAALALLMLTTIGGYARAGVPTKVDQVHTFSDAPMSRALEFLPASDLAPAPGEELIGVSFSLELFVSGGSVSVDNDGPEPAFVNVFYEATLTLTSDDVTIPVISASVLNADRLNLAPDDEHTGGPPVFTDDDGPDTATMPAMASAYASVTAELDSALFDQFRAGEPFRVHTLLDTRFGISGIPTIAGTFDGITVESVAITLSYTYTPAPSTAALMGIAAFVTNRRRR
ncbi:MAG: hypothetical protein Tsb0013_17060 [Phycisphaerales bacterium]